MVARHVVAPPRGEAGQRGQRQDGDGQTGRTASAAAGEQDDGGRRGEQCPGDHRIAERDQPVDGPVRDQRERPAGQRCGGHDQQPPRTAQRHPGRQQRGRHQRHDLGEQLSRDGGQRGHPGQLTSQGEDRQRPGRRGTAQHAHRQRDGEHIEHGHQRLARTPQCLVGERRRVDEGQPVVQPGRGDQAQQGRRGQRHRAGDGDQPHRVSGRDRAHRRAGGTQAQRQRQPGDVQPVDERGAAELGVLGVALGRGGQVRLGHVVGPPRPGRLGQPAEQVPVALLQRAHAGRTDSRARAARALASCRATSPSSAVRPAPVSR